jgi:hypothetical protein
MARNIFLFANPEWKVQVVGSGNSLTLWIGEMGQPRPMYFGVMEYRVLENRS